MERTTVKDGTPVTGSGSETKNTVGMGGGGESTTGGIENGELKAAATVMLVKIEVAVNPLALVKAVVETAKAIGEAMKSSQTKPGDPPSQDKTKEH